MVLSLDFFNFVKLIGFESIVAGECKSCDFISNFVSEDEDRRRSFSSFKELIFISK